MAKAKTQNRKDTKAQKTGQVSSVKGSAKSKKTAKSEPIVVAQIMGKWLGGGVEAVIMNYYRHIDRSKIQFDFICDKDSTNIPYDEIEKLGGKVILCPPYQKLPKYLKFLKQLFREKKYRIVHSNINTLSVFPLYAAKKAGVPVRIAHSHSTSNPREWKKNLMKNALRPFSKVWATDYFACSELAGRYLFGDKAFESGKVKIIRNAIDVEKFKFDPEARKRLRKEFGFEDDDYVIGNVGRMVTAKNQLFLIDAFCEYKKENPNAKLLIIGDGDLRPKIDEKIRKLGLQKDVHIEEYRKDINKCYSAMDLFAFPSIYEGFGMVAIEAQAAGVHVFASSHVPCEANVGLLDYRVLDNDFLCEKDKKHGFSTCCTNKIFEYDIYTNNKKLTELYLELSKIKILYIGMTQTHGGIETFVKNYTDYISKNNFCVYHLKNSQEKIYFQDDFIKKGHIVFDVPSYRKRPFSYIYKARKIINENNIQIVHVNMNSAVFLYPLIAGRLSSANNNSSDKGFLKEALHWINKHLIPLLATDYFACSVLSSEWFYSKKIRKKKCVVIPNAIDIKRFSFNLESRKRIRDIFNISNDEILIGHVGRFNPQKNHKYIIEIFQKYLKKEPKAKLMLIGEGPLKKEILLLIKQKKLSKRIIVCGNRDDINDFYSAFDIFLMPSLYEGLPLVGIEAQASGCRVIFSDKITTEVKIIPDTIFLSIGKDKVIDWVKNIEPRKSRRECNFYIKKYDIATQIRNLERIYETV